MRSLHLISPDLTIFSEMTLLEIIFQQKISTRLLMSGNYFNESWNCCPESEQSMTCKFLALCRFMTVSLVCGDILLESAVLRRDLQEHMNAFSRVKTNINESVLRLQSLKVHQKIRHQLHDHHVLRPRLL